MPQYIPIHRNCKRPYLCHGNSPWIYDQRRGFSTSAHYKHASPQNIIRQHHLPCPFTIKQKYNTHSSNSAINNWFKTHSISFAHLNDSKTCHKLFILIRPLKQPSAASPLMPIYNQSHTTHSSNSAKSNKIKAATPPNTASAHPIESMTRSQSVHHHSFTIKKAKYWKIASEHVTPISHNQSTETCLTPWNWRDHISVVPGTGSCYYLWRSLYLDGILIIQLHTWLLPKINWQSHIQMGQISWWRQSVLPQSYAQ